MGFHHVNVQTKYVYGPSSEFLPARNSAGFYECWELLLKAKAWAHNCLWGIFLLSMSTFYLQYDLRGCFPTVSPQFDQYERYISLVSDVLLHFVRLQNICGYFVPVFYSSWFIIVTQVIYSADSNIFSDYMSDVLALASQIKAASLSDCLSAAIIVVGSSKQCHRCANVFSIFN